MSIHKIIVQYNTSQIYSESDAVVVTLDELRKWVLNGAFLRHLFRYKESELRTYNVKFIPKPLLVAILLRLMSRGKCSFKDNHSGQAITLRTIGKLFLQFLIDLVKKPALLKRVRNEVDLLSDEYTIPKSIRTLNLLYTPVYLRTDLWFGVTSGGSVGHIAGVLNNLDNFTGNPVFLTSDIIPTVRKDLDVCFLSPEKRFWDFKELPSFFYNETFAQDAHRFLDGKKLSFIYQRYSLNNYSGVMLARYHNIPFVLEYNGSEIWITRNWGTPLKYEILSERIELLNLKAADLIVVVSQPMKDELVGRGIGAGKILGNPNGVDPETYSPDVDGSGIRSKWGIDSKTVIGFIGTFGRWHGAEVLAEAFGRLVREFPQYRDKVRLLMIGDGITMPEVKENLKKYGIEDIAILTGLVPQEDGPKYLAACDILASPHVPNPDGTPFFGSPTKLFEYMAMGKGIVASDLDQIGEILEHNRTAWMVKPGDAGSLMLGLKALIDGIALRNSLGLAAREEAIAKYTWAKHVQKIISALEKRTGKERV